MYNFISFNDFKQETKLKRTPLLNKTILAGKNTEFINDSVELSKNLTEAKNKNGIIEKVADKIKGFTGIGFSSKKIQKDIENNKNSEAVKKDIKNYRRQQEGIAQATADVATGLASIFTFFKVKNKTRLYAGGISSLNEKGIEDIISKLKEGKIKDLIQKITSKLDKKSTAVIIGAISAMFIGSFVKSNLLKLNRIGSKEFKIDKTKNYSKKELKQEKKRLKKEKRNANFRNSISGAISGLTAPVITLFGPAGAFAYAGINSLSRYFIASRADKNEKSIKSYVENLKNSPVQNLAAAALLIFPALKTGKADKIFEKNLSKVIEKLKNAKLEDKYSSESVYSKLESILFGDEKINGILNDNNLTTSQKIQKLGDENIFALKFKQIGSNTDDLARALKEECPATRTLEEAKEKVSKAFGKKYEVEGCVGVGTIAESYIAKDENGNHVVIKMIKEGISKEKINSDKEAFIQIIKNSAGKSEEEKDILIKNIENIAQGVLQEVDLANEKTAAEALRKVTQKAKVVVPIEIKDNMYVMEKANGISLQNLIKYLEYQHKYNIHSKIGDKGDSFFTNMSDDIKQKLEEFIKLNPGLEDVGDISTEEAKKLIEKYDDVLIEQFSKVGEKGKTIHADIHPGNIFIDMKALRNGEKNFFTLIDTGNVINQTPESAIRFLNLSNYIQNADVDNITNFVLEGAKLPEGMTKEKAFEAISSELRKVFFDDKTSFGFVSNDSVINLSSSIMEKLNIIPGDTQGNLLKAKTSANQSKAEFLRTLMTAFENKFINAKPEEMSKAKIASDVLSLAKDAGKISIKSKIKTMLQEKLNLKTISPALRSAIKKSANVPARNSEEYIMYKLKPFKDLKGGLEKLIEQKFEQLDNFGF